MSNLGSSIGVFFLVWPSFIPPSLPECLFIRSLNPGAFASCSASDVARRDFSASNLALAAINASRSPFSRTTFPLYLRVAIARWAGGGNGNGNGSGGRDRAERAGAVGFRG